MLSAETKTRLFDTAYQYKATKLWKKLRDQQLFGVTLPDGRIGYCCVMGLQGEHVALAVYIGQEGISTYFDLLESDSDDADIDAFALIPGMGQSCLQCIFDDYCWDEQIADAKADARARHIQLRGPLKYPHFDLFVPMQRPQPIVEEADAEVLLACLRAAIFVSSRGRGKGLSTPFWDGMDLFPVCNPGDPITVLTEIAPGAFSVTTDTIPDYVEPVMPEIQPIDEFTLARLKRYRASETWDCGMAYFSMSIIRDNPAFIPSMPVAVNPKTEMTLPIVCLGDFDGEPDEMYREFIERMIEIKKRPAVIRVHSDDQRGQTFFSLLARQTGVPMQVSDDLPELNEAILKLTTGKEAQGDDEIEDTIEDFYHLIRAADLDTMRSFPPEIQMLAASLLSHPDIPRDVAAKIRKCMKYWDLS